MELRGGFVGCVPGGMLIDPGNIGLALDGQLFLRWRFFVSSGFLGLYGRPWQAPRYSVRREGYAYANPHPEERPSGRVSKDAGPAVASWFSRRCAASSGDACFAGSSPLRESPL